MLSSAQYHKGPLGEATRLSGTQGTHDVLRFWSKCTDDETGLLYYGQRFYDPAAGRWLSRDPIEEAGGMNLFGFVRNSPANRVDPIGLQMAPPGWPWPPPGWPRFPEPPPKPPQYPRGFALCQRDIEKDGSCDCPAIFTNAIGGEHAYMQHVDDEGNKWGYGFGEPGTAPETHFDPNGCKTCNKTGGTLKHGSGSGKSGNAATDDEIKDCIKDHPPSKDYEAWGKNRYNCKDWAKEAAANCGLDCN
jgi:RHS repeat-associated protein